MTYEKLKMSMWLLKILQKNVMKTKDEVMQNLWLTYHDITPILQKCKIRDKSKAVIGRILLS